MSATPTARDAVTTRALPSLEGPVPALFCTAGAAVGIVGALPWVAVLGGASGIGWAVRALAVVALLAGVFALLIGIGLFRARSAIRAGAARAAQEATLDAELTATMADADAREPDCADHTACASCDASCALNALRT